MGSIIIGSGTSFPSRSFDNNQMSKWIDGRKSADWIAEKFSIYSRPSLYDFSGRKRSEEMDIDIIAEAAKSALNRASLNVKAVDAILVVSTFPSVFPDLSAQLHHRLGCREDVFTSLGAGGCCSTLTALHQADCLLKTGSYKNVLLVMSCNLSTTINEENKEKSWLQGLIFGDGAAALVLTNDSSKRGFQNFEMFTEHDNDVVVNRSYMDFNFRQVPINLNEKSQFLVKKFRNHTDSKTVIVNNSNYRHQKKIADDNNFKTLFHIHEFGNLGPASLATSIHHHLSNDAIENEIVMMSIGTGLQYGYAIYRDHV